MNRFYLLIAVVMALAATPCFGASDTPGEITVLDQETFLMQAISVEGTEILQLFKIQNNEIVMVDAILISEKKVNFRPLLEYRRLKVERRE